MIGAREQFFDFFICRYFIPLSLYYFFVFCVFAFAILSQNSNSFRQSYHHASAFFTQLAVFGA